jgi:hypothetical protein
MIDYVFVFFLPGSAGNFFSRCLSLASNQAYGWVPKDAISLDLSSAEKHHAFGYRKSKQYRDWIRFEGQLVHYSTLVDHWCIPNNSISIWSEHPRYQLLDKDLVGTDNHQHVFYIDPTKNFEWVILNSLYKNSMLDVKWFQEGQIMLDDPNIHKINLANIIADPDSLWSEVEKVYAIINHKCSNKELVQALWAQWYTTTLKSDDFESFKNSIGFRL